MSSSLPPIRSIASPPAGVQYASGGGSPSHSTSPSHHRKTSGPGRVIASPTTTGGMRGFVSGPPSSIATSSSRPPSSGLAHTVTQARKWAQAVNDTAEAAAYYSKENELMESILSEDHSMVSNHDLSRVMEPLLSSVGLDGKTRCTAILAVKRPPVLYAPGRAHPDGIIERREAKLGRVNTGKVNYSAMLLEQSLVEQSNKQHKEKYDQLLADFVKKQQELQDRFS